MNHFYSCIAAVLLLATAAWCQEIKRPVFFLRYDGGTESEELEAETSTEEESVFDSQRHKITFRIKEQWSDELTTNLYTAVSSKIYDDGSGDYSYLYLTPNCIWDITDRVRWVSELRCKWTWYEQADTEGNSKDLTSLLAKTEFAFRPVDRVKIIPSLRAVFDLYENPAKLQQVYTAGMRVESRINPQVRLSGRYRGILRLRLSEYSEVGEEFNNEFGVNLCWDPNK